MSRRSGFVEDHGVEAVADEEARILIELDGFVVGFGYGEGDGGETGAGEVVDAVLEQCDTEALAAIGCSNAELCDVRHVIGDAGAKEHSDQRAVMFVAEYPGGFGIEDAAAGKANDVV